MSETYGRMLFKVMSDSAVIFSLQKAPARCPATLRPWRGALGEDQAVRSKACGKRGPLDISECHSPGVLVLKGAVS
jgi:hypothetical protein